MMLTASRRHVRSSRGMPTLPVHHARFLVHRSIAAASLAATLLLPVSFFPNPAAAGEPGAVGDLYVTSWSDSKVVQFDGETGALVGDFVASGSGGLSRANGLTWGPNGNLFVCSDGDQPPHNYGVAEYDGTTGEFLRWFVGPERSVESRWIDRPFEPVFGPDGNLYVSASQSENILKYDGTTGEWLSTFAIGGFSPGCLRRPYGMAFGPNGNLFVVSGYDASNPTGEGRGIFEYHHATGRFLRALSGSLDVDMPLGSSLLFRPNGNLLLTSTDMDLVTGETYRNEVLEFDVETGELLGPFVPDGSGLSRPQGMTWGPDGNLFVVSRNTASIIEYDGETGALIGTFASGGLSRPVDLAFKPAPPEPMEAPAITGVSVSEADACAGLTGVTVIGTNLDADATSVKLMRAGEPDYVGIVTASSGDGTSLTVDFDFDSGIISSGAWDVMVANPDGQADTLEAAIDVTGCRSARTRNLLATAYRHRNHTIAGILEYDGETGDVLGWFVEDRTDADTHFGELWLAPGMTIGPDGDVFVACGEAGDGNYAVVRFDGVTGRRVGEFVPVASGGIIRPFGLTFGPNGNLFVVDRPVPPAIPSAVFEYDGSSGAFVRVVVERGACGLTNGRELIFSEDGDVLLVTSVESGVIAFDAETGACIGVLGETGDPPGDWVAAVDWSPHSGNLVVPKAISDSVVEYDADTGALIRTLVEPGSGGLDVGDRAAFGPNGNYFVASHGPNEILEYDGTSGAFLGSFGSAESEAGGASNFDLVFGPIPADADGDWDLDLGDFATFQRCLAGDGVSPGYTNCLVFDNDGDGDVDVGDAAAFAARMTGPA